MTNYVKTRKVNNLPRIPLEGSIDLTYRCNNNCRHCWLRIPANSPDKENELTFDEIRGIVDEARKMGCGMWNISGGEPMLRPDFTEIFEYITRNSIGYTLNTNGTLITPDIAQLMCQKGSKMVALYGATAEIFDHVTRMPGSFERTMRGFAYLKEAGAAFIVQIVPMQDNYRQLDEMFHLAKSLSPHWRIGAAWLYLTAEGDPERNNEIRRQRLDPRKVIELDKPDLYSESVSNHENRRTHVNGNNRLLTHCIRRNKFHIGPYGTMSFCGFITDPTFRYDLRTGSFQEAWDDFIPSLVASEQDEVEYLRNCASCELSRSCRWCPGYGHLEHRRLSAKIEYLCAMAKESRCYENDWKVNHSRHYRIGGMTVQVTADLPIVETTFSPKFRDFQDARQCLSRAGTPNEGTIHIHHCFSFPQLSSDMGQKVHEQPSWTIYRKNNCWIYLGGRGGSDKRPSVIAVFNQDHTRVRIYHKDEKYFRSGNLTSLTGFPTDQIQLSRVLADRKGCFLHSCATIFKGKGLLFVGQSGAGKSTMINMLMHKEQFEILTDDRNIIRRRSDGFWVYGTWSHGQVPLVSASKAPLGAILFLEQASKNQLVPLKDRREIVRQFIVCLIKPLQTADWWDKMLDLAVVVARQVPCYRLQFEKSHDVVNKIEKWFNSRQAE